MENDLIECTIEALFDAHVRKFNEKIYLRQVYPLYLDGLNQTPLFFDKKYEEHNNKMLPDHSCWIRLEYLGTTSGNPLKILKVIELDNVIDDIKKKSVAIYEFDQLYPIRKSDFCCYQFCPYFRECDDRKESKYSFQYTNAPKFNGDIWTLKFKDTGTTIRTSFIPDKLVGFATRDEEYIPIEKCAIVRNLNLVRINKNTICYDNYFSLGTEKLITNKLYILK